MGVLKASFFKHRRTEKGENQRILNFILTLLTKGL